VAPRLSVVVVATAVALSVALTGALAVWGAGGASRGPEVVVTSAAGEVLVRVPAPGGQFAVGYRNSLYGSRAEERYRLTPGGRFALEELAADQVAVLEEYYAVAETPRRAGRDDRRQFVVDPHPGRAPSFVRLSIAATDLGERTLLVPGSPPVALWRLVDGADPTVVLQVQGSR
jgi:hypothetical protein